MFIVVGNRMSNPRVPVRHLCRVVVCELWYLDLNSLPAGRTKFIASCLRHPIKGMSTGSSIFLHLPRVSFDSCLAPTTEWPCAIFWHNRKSDKLCPGRYCLHVDLVQMLLRKGIDLSISFCHDGEYTKKSLLFNIQFKSKKSLISNLCTWLKHWTCHILFVAKGLGKYIFILALVLREV